MGGTSTGSLGRNPNRSGPTNPNNPAPGKDKVLDEVRHRTGLKMPHAGDRAPGGGYYMTDSDADL
jgi:hypothetical protein